VSDQRPSDVLGALPRHRPHRRSAKRPSHPPADTAQAILNGDEDATARRGPARRARDGRPKQPKRTGPGTRRKQAPETAAGGAPRAPEPAAVGARSARGTRAAGANARSARGTPAAGADARNARGAPAAGAGAPDPAPIGDVRAAPPPKASRSRSPRLPQPAQPAGVPPKPHGSRPAQPRGRHDLLGTAAQAAAELAEIGLSVSARALRHAVSRLPRP
jgi:hypothetical protein